MPVASTLRELGFEEALLHLDEGAALVDLRGVDDYLDVHVPGSLALLYEFGPGMASRARDCIPLDVPLVIMSLGAGDPAHAAASLRGKGFTVLGQVDDAINRWARERGTPASTEVAGGEQAPPGTLLDVGDPAAPRPEEARRIPIERLWTRARELSGDAPVVVIGGYGVRAALAIGMLERAGVGEVQLWRPRRVGPPARPHGA